MTMSSPIIAKIKCNKIRHALRESYMIHGNKLKKTSLLRENRQNIRQSYEILRKLPNYQK